MPRLLYIIILPAYVKRGLSLETQGFFEKKNASGEAGS